ncbi:MAG: rhomboid family intramembrane serine protease [Candidatus Eisenbacteria bacterium]|nr:rhomboid family intramembrane serine protease [Candidatus Eisenbacteria bacterium]
MIPLRDNIPSRTRPGAGIVLIAVTMMVFLYELNLSHRDLESFFMTYGLVPGRLTGLLHPSYYPFEGSRYLGLFSSMFLHAGWFHFLGNMWFLWIFGDNVEDHLGHRRFVIFYLICGVAAGLAQIIADPGSHLPMVGASGAIAGVMGAYFVLFPRAKILTLIPIFIIFTWLEIPAVIFLGIWFLMQFVNGAVMSAANVQGGVAFWAHAGGFIAGMLFLGLLGGWRKPDPPVAKWSRQFSGGMRGL